MLWCTLSESISKGGSTLHIHQELRQCMVMMYSGMEKGYSHGFWTPGSRWALVVSPLLQMFTSLISQSHFYQYMYLDNPLFHHVANGKHLLNIIPHTKRWCSLKKPGPIFCSHFFKPSEVLVSDESSYFCHNPWWIL